jgi:hypothetical protein
MDRIRTAFVGAACAIVLLLVGARLVSSPVRASMQDTVRLATGSTVALATPDFIVKGKRYAFTWPGGGPPQTFTVKDLRRDGWILVEVAEENIDPNLVPYGTLPVRWLNAAIATSIQEMRPILPGQ